MLAGLVFVLLTMPAKDAPPITGVRADTFYVDNKGNDASDGSRAHPFRTLERLSTVTLTPGDRILLAGGQTFNGTVHFVHPPLGTSERAITISSTGLQPAVIFSGDSTGMRLNDARYVRLQHLEFRGRGRKAGNHSDGVIIDHCQQVSADNILISGYQKSGLFIHSSTDVLAYKISARNNGAAGIYAAGEWENRNCERIQLVQCSAINNPGDPTNLTNHSGNGILAGYCRNVLIDSCVATNNGWDMPRKGNGPVGIWCFESDSVTIQHCIAYRNKTSPGGGDGGGFDLDGGVTNSIIQYCLSYENQGSAFGLFQYDGARPWNNNTVRFCISINDGSISPAQAAVFIWNSSGDSNQLANCYFYNNTIYNQKAAAISYEAKSLNKGFRFFNNYFVAAKGLLLGNETRSDYRGNTWQLLHHPGYISLHERYEVWRKRTGHESQNGVETGVNKDPVCNVSFKALPRKPEQLQRLFFLYNRQGAATTGIDLINENIPGRLPDFSGQDAATKKVGAF